MASILAVVTSDPEKASDGLPVFRAANEQEVKRLTLLLEKILDAAAHQLNDDLYILVDRH